MENITPQQQFEQKINAPQVNLIAPTPSPAISNMRPDFSRAATPQIISSLSEPKQDYRIAKPPISADYMRPSQEVDTPRNYEPLQGKVLPQNQPIDISKYADQYELSSLSTKAEVVGLVTNLRAPSPPQKIDLLQEEVAALEEIAASHNIEDIRDNIQTETHQPPFLLPELNNTPLQLDQETTIEITQTIPMVDIDELVEAEERNAAELHTRAKAVKRHKSPPPNQLSQPSIMDTLHLPGTRSPPRESQSPTEAKIKRQQTPERSFSSQHCKTMTIPTRTTNSAIPLQEASPEAKVTYAARFKSIFSSKITNESLEEPLPRQQKEFSQFHQISPSPTIRCSPSPTIKRSPSPAIKYSHSPEIRRSPSPSRLMSMFSKNKQTPIEVVSGSNAYMSKKSEPEPLSVKVTETFSLKVDEMDQYSSHPKRPPPPPPIATPTHSMYSSREDFHGADRVTTELSEPFVPVIVPAAGPIKFLAGNRTLYSSDIDMQSPHSVSVERRTSAVYSSDQSQQSTKGNLISVPININDSYECKFLPSSSNFRSPSEQRAMSPKLSHKSAFMEGRTQSQDRTRIVSSHEDMYGSRITKTVSFNFGERKSRLSDFENVNVSQQQRDQRDLLEKTYFSRDHEYEPIGEPRSDEKYVTTKDPSPAPQQIITQHQVFQEAKEIEEFGNELKEAEELQKDLEGRYFSSVTTTPRTESRTDYEVHTSQVDSSTLEELPLKPENSRKGFMASAHDRTRKMQAGIKTQAGKIKTKLRSPTKKPPSDSPKAKERKRFKAPEFSKMKMPEIKRPDMSKLKDFKRPEFTKFNKPDMSKFKLPEKFSTLKLRRSKSFKENEPVHDGVMMDETTTKPSSNDETVPPKKMFDFHFGTYPCAFRRNKKLAEQETSVFTGTGTGTEEPSVIPSTATQPSLESSSSPQGDRGPGPVRSRWADKFSDVSYNDSEGSRYRRFGSEQESFDRESSLEITSMENRRFVDAEAYILQAESLILAGL